MDVFSFKHQKRSVFVPDGAGGALKDVDEDIFVEVWPEVPDFNECLVKGLVRVILGA